MTDDPPSVWGPDIDGAQRDRRGYPNAELDGQHFLL